LVLWAHITILPSLSMENSSAELFSLYSIIIVAVSLSILMMIVKTVFSWNDCWLLLQSWWGWVHLKNG
jgi:hypothetical protein